MEFNKFIEWAFLGIVGGGVWILWLMYQTLNELNSKIAVVLERTDRHDEVINKHDDRLRALEINKRQ